MSPPHRDLQLPETIRATFEVAARAWLEAEPRRPAVTPKDAASVLLLREVVGEHGPRVEVFTQRRVPAMAFAASMHVYPGGGVDARDADGDLAWAGPGRTPTQWADVLAVDCERARMIVLAAVRELFEECGVLFAGRGSETTLTDLGGRWQDHRAELVCRRLTLAEMARRESLVVRSDLLHPVARWVTPECEALRYDTFFFAALVPDGQVADGQTSEAREAGWVAPCELLRREGDTLMAPTRMLAEQLAKADSLRAFLQRWPSLAPVRPYPVDTALGIRLRVPATPGTV
ncbi:MAG: NUDIX hydrolase [Ornithinimicrobium sp.]